MPLTPKTVLVICIGNSCRSPMAEAILNHDLAGHVRAISAGTHPQIQVSTGTIAALQALGVPTASLIPKGIEQVINEPIDLVVTLCDYAKPYCPVFPPHVIQLHLPFRDPHHRPLELFIALRDDMRARLVPAVVRALNLNQEAK